MAISFLPVTPAKAAPAAPKTDMRLLALALTDGFIIPAYRDLADATQRQVQVWAGFAAKRDSADITPLRIVYHMVADAWATAQIVKTGPITLFLRADRFAYWPEARNVTQRTLDTLLASRNPKDLASDTLAHDSIAAQGLTALERLLYGDMYEEMLRAPGAIGQWRAAVGLGIARNLDRIAHDVLNDWIGPNGVRAALAANKDWNHLFADGSEFSRLLLTDLVGAFKTMLDVKLLPAMGTGIDTAKPNAAEAWRSSRSARDLKRNLAAAQALNGVFARAIPAANRQRLDTLFAAAGRAVDNVPGDLGAAAADPKRRPTIEAARTAIRAVQTDLVKTLPNDLGISVGFNNLDGD